MTFRRKGGIRSKICVKIKTFEDVNIFSCLECSVCVMKDKIIRRKNLQLSMSKLLLS